MERLMTVVKPFYQNLVSSGLKVIIKSNIWNDERAQLIARAKTVINIHYYDNNILETARLSYLLSNDCYVISENSQDPLLDKWHSNYVVFGSYDRLHEICDQCLNDEPQRDRLRQQLQLYKNNQYSQQYLLIFSNHINAL